jgi:hypothetical protein
MKSMAEPGWFFLKEITSSPLRSMYPYPVSGLVELSQSHDIFVAFSMAS